MAQTRRDFLKQTGCAALTGAALVSGIEQLSMINAYAQSSSVDYKALVCIFMDGGNDCNNMIIPFDDYAGGYTTVRGSSGLAIPKAQLLQVTPPSKGVSFGLHPNLSPEVANGANVQGGAGILPVWSAGKLAVLCNVGTLVQPLTKQIYQTNANARPMQIGSHSDQQDQHMTAVSDVPSVTGWGGRTADVLKGINDGATGPAALPMVVSIGGNTIFGAGTTARPLAVAGSNTPLNQILLLNFTGTTAEKQSRGLAFDQIRNAVEPQYLAKAYNDTTASSLLAATALQQDQTLTTVFPNSGLGSQLKQVAKIMKANLTQQVLGLKRQVFFTRFGGFDTHSNQRNGGQDSLMQQLGQAMGAFYKATVELGIADKVTTFTMSDFGRTFEPAGTGTNVGSDHAWGGHQLIMGGSVKGGEFYGTFPTLALKGPDDTDDRGRWIPSTSIQQYAATLAKWYGVAPADLSTVIPNLNRFPNSDLGFMM